VLPLQIAPAVEGTLRVLRAARDAGVKRVVVTSTFGAAGYGVLSLSVPGSSPHKDTPQLWMGAFNTDERHSLAKLS